MIKTTKEKLTRQSDCFLLNHPIRGRSEKDTIAIVVLMRKLFGQLDRDSQKRFWFLFGKGNDILLL